MRSRPTTWRAGIRLTDSQSFATQVFEIAPNYFALTNTFEDVHDLALAYYFTGSSKYSARAVAKLYTWFLNPATSMLPNLVYASVIRGDESSSTGRPQVRRLPARPTSQQM